MATPVTLSTMITVRFGSQTGWSSARRTETTTVIKMETAPVSAVGGIKSVRRLI